MIKRLLAAALLALLPVTARGNDLASPVVAPSTQVLVLLHLPPPHFRAGTDYGGSYGDGAGLAARRRIARGLARRNGLTLVDAWPMPLLGLDCFVMAVPPGRAPADAATALSADRSVALAQPVGTFVAQGRPDPLFAAQPAATAWRLADLHRRADGRGVRVAVVDSGVDDRHPDLAGQIAVSTNFVAGRAPVAEAHGTAVAGVIAAAEGNGMGIAGIAPRARLLALRACWQDVVATVCDSFSLAKAISFAIEHDAQVINLSLGGPDDPLLGRLVDAGLRRGIMVVAAVAPDAADGGFPASHAGVIAVAADAGGGRRSVYLAPGHGVPTTQVGAKWRLVDGSSFAAAHVSGLVALRLGQVRGPVRLVADAGGAIDACATLGFGTCPPTNAAR